MKCNIIGIILVLFYMITVQTIWGQENDCYCDKLYVAQGFTGPDFRTFANGGVRFRGDLVVGKNDEQSGRIYDNGRFETIRGNGAVGIVLMNRQGNQAPYIMWDPVQMAYQRYMHAIRQYKDFLEFSRFTDYPDGKKIIMTLDGESGNIGIGIEENTPIEKLDVSGAIRLGDTDNANVGTIRWNGSHYEGYKDGGWVKLDEEASSGSGLTLYAQDVHSQSFILTLSDYDYNSDKEWTGWVDVSGSEISVNVSDTSKLLVCYNGNYNWDKFGQQILESPFIKIQFIITEVGGTNIESAASGGTWGTNHGWDVIWRRVHEVGPGSYTISAQHCFVIWDSEWNNTATRIESCGLTGGTISVDVIPQ